MDDLTITVPGALRGEIGALLTTEPAPLAIAVGSDSRRRTRDPRRLRLAADLFDENLSDPSGAPDHDLPDDNA